MPLRPFTPATRAWFEATFAAPTRIQDGGWPHIAAAAHTHMLAPIGTGKTLARLWVYGRGRRACLRCRTALRSRRLGGHLRGPVWCPRCQPESDRSR